MVVWVAEERGKKSWYGRASDPFRVCIGFFLKKVPSGDDHNSMLRRREVTKTKSCGRKDARWDLRVDREMDFHDLMIRRSRYFLNERE